MSFRLFGRPYSGSLAVEWLLEELELPYARVLVTGYGDGIQPPWYRDINPIGQVPALELPGGKVLTESGAIMLYLAELKADVGLMPPIGDPARPEYLRWMIFLSATIYPTMMRFFHPENYVEDPGQFETVKDYGVRALTAQWTMIEDGLAATGYLAGDRMSAADIYLAMFAAWADEIVSGWLTANPRSRRLFDELSARPAMAAILERHKTGTWSD